MNLLMRQKIWLPILIILYILLSSIGKQTNTHVSNRISPPLPLPVAQLISLGFGKQLLAEISFIKANVFYGGYNPTAPMRSENLEHLAQHFLFMAKLHPKLIDIYYVGESILAWSGTPYVLKANHILTLGQQALPNELTLPFFLSFNYFKHLQQPKEAAYILKKASSLPDAPQWFGHLASTLLAKAGNIRTSLSWLKSMQALLRNQQEKLRYQNDIIAFEKALTVQDALDKFKQENGHFPGSLENLMPVYLYSMPQWDGLYVLNYTNSILSLQKKTRKE